MFGKEISYADIVETIQAADTRIKYVALNPLDELKLEKAPLEDMTKVYKIVLSRVSKRVSKRYAPDF